MTNPSKGSLGLLFFAAMLVVSTIPRRTLSTSRHVLSPAQRRASADVPPFATIAKSPSFDAKQLAFFLLEPHTKVLDLTLSRAAADDIAAYIAMLKQKSVSYVLAGMIPFKDILNGWRQTFLHRKSKIA